MKAVGCTGFVRSSLGKALHLALWRLLLFLGKKPRDPWRGAENFLCDWNGLYMHMLDNNTLLHMAKYVLSLNLSSFGRFKEIENQSTPDTSSTYHDVWRKGSDVLCNPRCAQATEKQSVYVAVTFEQPHQHIFIIFTINSVYVTTTAVLTS